MKMDCSYSSLLLDIKLWMACYSFFMYLYIMKKNLSEAHIFQKI